MAKDDLRIKTRHLEFVFIEDPPGYLMLCRACGQELLRVDRREADKGRGPEEEAVIDHLYRQHRITEAQMRDDVESRIEQAQRDGELPPDFRFN